VTANFITLTDKNIYLKLEYTLTLICNKKKLKPTPPLVMITYNKIISDYIKVDDTAVKNAIIDLFVDSKNASLPNFMDDLLMKCGLISINIMLVEGKKWDAYMSFNEENIFLEKKGMQELIKAPNSKLDAEKLLASKLIELLDTVDFYSFIKRVK